MIIVLWIISAESLFIKNSLDYQERFGYMNTLVHATINLLFLISMLYFGIRVAIYDPTDPVVYLQRIHKNDPIISAALDKDLLY